MQEVYYISSLLLIPKGSRGLPLSMRYPSLGFCIIHIPQELVKSNRDSVRKAKNIYIIDKGKTLEPLGINKMECNTFFPLNHFYISNFLYIAASTVSVFIYFQRSLIPFFYFYLLLWYHFARYPSF